MIFRVHGARADGSKSFIDVECASEAVARNTAVRRGFVNTDAIEVISQDIAVDVVRPTQRPPRPSSDPLSIRFAFKMGLGFGLGLAVAALIAGAGYVVLMIFGVALDSHA